MLSFNCGVRTGAVGSRRGSAVPGLRSFAQVGVTVLSLGLVIGGLYFSMSPSGKGVVLMQPGAAARIGSDATSATAFFEIQGDLVELTMLFTEPDDPASVFKTRVRLLDGQSHSVVVGEPADGGTHRYTFRRIGYTVEMRLVPVKTLNASFTFPG